MAPSPALSALMDAGKIWKIKGLDSDQDAAGGGADSPLHRPNPALWGSPLGVLARGAVHEWFLDWPGPAEAAAGRRDPAWRAPLALLAWLAQHHRRTDAAGRPRDGLVVWIGLRCRPTPWLLDAADPGDGPAPWRGEDDLPGHLFVTPANDTQRVWALDQALRCPAVQAVVADGSGLSLALTRRLQLAAEAGGTLGLLARPPADRRTLSAAATRWQVRPEPGPTSVPHWTVELLRCKGVQPAAPARAWRVQWACEVPGAKACVRVSAPLVGGAVRPPVSPDERAASA